MEEYLILILLGIISICSLGIKAVLSKIRFSPIPFYILFGIAIKLLLDQAKLETKVLDSTITLFGEIGLILILFQVGLESNLDKLKKQIKTALVISIPEVIISGLTVFLALYYLAALRVEVSLVIAIAFVASSIAISMQTWKEAKKLDSPLGDLLIDLSAMNDVAGITLMAITLVLVEQLSQSTEAILITDLLITVLWTICKLLTMIGFAYAFAQFFEKKLTSFLIKLEPMPDPVIFILSLTLIFSGIVGYLEFSSALGAFLIGLAFSRDAKAVKLLTTYISLETFFVPFFFIAVGYAISFESSISLTFVLLLAGAAYLGKICGVVVPAQLRSLPLSQSLLLGASMIPRAEITLVVIKHAHHIPAIGLSSELFTASILAVLMTSLTPIFLTPALAKYQPQPS